MASVPRFSVPVEEFQITSGPGIDVMRRGVNCNWQSALREEFKVKTTASDRVFKQKVRIWGVKTFEDDMSFMGIALRGNIIFECYVGNSRFIGSYNVHNRTGTLRSSPIDYTSPMPAITQS